MKNAAFLRSTMGFSSVRKLAEALGVPHGTLNNINYGRASGALKRLCALAAHFADVLPEDQRKAEFEKFLESLSD